MSTRLSPAHLFHSTTAQTAHNWKHAENQNKLSPSYITQLEPVELSIAVFSRVKNNLPLISITNI
jgi:hypothetical protein